MDSIKSEALNLIQKLPDDASLEDIMYELYVLNKIRSGQQAMQAGDSMPAEQLRKEIETW